MRCVASSPLLVSETPQVAHAEELVHMCIELFDLIDAHAVDHPTIGIEAKVEVG